MAPRDQSHSGCLIRTPSVRWQVMRDLMNESDEVVARERGLDYLRRASVVPDPRVVEAIDLVQKKRDSAARWPLENPHAGEVHFDLEVGVGKPSRWNTLRALRVLDWYSGRE